MRRPLIQRAPTAPLPESRVCQYENSPDNHSIIDRHPRRGSRAGT